MSSFEDRKKSFEKKFAHDQELQFKVSARRNKYLGEWVSQILNFNSDQEKEYIQSVIKADFAEAGDQDVFRKIKDDLKANNVSDEELRKKMDEFNEKAKIIIDTSHSVKGGEADNVLIYEKANWPSNFSTKNLKDKMAEARVWYTGITRSKTSLHILSTHHTYFLPLGRLASNFNRRTINQ